MFSGVCATAMIHHGKTVIAQALLALLIVCGVVSTAAADYSRTEIRIAVADEIHQSGIGAALIKRFVDQNPDVRIKVVPVVESRALSLARDGVVDAAIMERSGAIDLLDAWAVVGSRQELLRGLHVLVAPSDDPLKLLSSTDIEDAIERLANSRSTVILPPAQTPIATRFEGLLSLTRNGRAVPVVSFAGDDVKRLEVAARRRNHTVVHLGHWIESRRSVRQQLRLVRNAALQSVYEYVIFDVPDIPDSAYTSAQDFGAFLRTQATRDFIADFGADQGLRQFTPAAELRTSLDLVEHQDASIWLHRFGIGSLLLILAITFAVLPQLYFRERARYRSVSRLMRAVEGARDGVWDWDIQTNRAFFTQRSFKVLGLPPENTGVTSPMKLFLSAVHSGWRDSVREELEMCQQRNKNGRFSIDFRVQDKKDKPVWVRMRGMVLTDENNKVTRLSGSVMDVSTEKAQEAQLRHQVMHDSLTGLPNRALMNHRLEKTLVRSRDSDESFALIMIDLNRFKEINDSLGHGVGDELLRAVAGRLTGAVRDKDTVARLGGDEFAILLPAVDAQAAFGRAQKVRDALSRNAVILAEHSLLIEGSIGISMFPDHGDSAEALMQRADIAMYTSKRNKIPVTFYSAAANPHGFGRIELENELRKAIETDGLELHYQPKLELRTGRFVGVEALIRWTHPEYGVVRPQQVAELAEKSGLIHTLSAWVIRTASKQAARWAAEGVTVPMAINLSVWNIQNPDIVNLVKTCIRESRVSPKLVEFEITESAMIVDPIRAHKTLEQLSNLGIGFSVDDFGTGFSSLAYLKRLPVQTVKIDQSFVRDMLKDLADRSIVQSTIDMAHNLGLKVVAEGIEEEAMLDMLIEMKCDMGQGFLFSKAMPPEELFQWLASSPHIKMPALTDSNVVSIGQAGAA